MLESSKIVLSLSSVILKIVDLEIKVTSFLLLFKIYTKRLLRKSRIDLFVLI